MKEDPPRNVNLTDYHYEALNISATEVFRQQLKSETEAEFEKPIAREFIKLKQIFDRKRVASQVHAFTENTVTSKRLIL